MDIDPPVFTQINKAYTEDDKKRHHSEGRCFNCSRIGHMANQCPLKKKQSSQWRSQMHSQSSSKSHREIKSIPCKWNQSRFRKQYQKPTKLGQPSQSYARTASIEEVNESNQDEEDIPQLAACISKFSEGQHKQWVEEMKSLGINF